MRLLVATAALLVALSPAAFAQCPTFEFWGGGPQRCAAQPAPGGGAYVLGLDIGRRTYWMTDVDPRGNMYGYDARGNYWTFDRRSGTYRYFNATRDW